MIYRINRTDIFKNLKYSISILIFAICCFLVNIIWEHIFDMRMILFLTALQLLVVVLLFIDYLKNSSKGQIIIEHNQITIQEKTVKTIVLKKDIEEVIVYGAPSVRRKSMFRLLPFEAFHYVDIKGENFKSIILTSLSDYRLYWNISKEPIFKGKLKFYRGDKIASGSLFNSIFWNSLEG